MENLHGQKNISNIKNVTNLLFYMENCKTCNFFINTAQKANILRNFKMICIDGQKEKFRSQGLKKVPTIIIPSINKQFDGNDCLKWLDDMIKITSMKNRNINGFGLQNEQLYIPDIEIINSNSNPNINTQTNLNTKLNLTGQTNLHSCTNTNSSKVGVNKDQISELSSKISQLSKQINNNCNGNGNTNQFEVPKTNVIKRNILNPVQPPVNIMGKTTVSTVKLNNNKNINTNTNTQSQSQNIPSVKPINQLFGYLKNEMSGYSDSYAYIDIDNPLPKSFLPPDKDMEIYTAPEGNKIDKQKQEQMIRLEEMERNNQKDIFKKTIDEINNKIAMGDNNYIPNWIGSNKNL